MKEDTFLLRLPLILLMITSLSYVSCNLDDPEHTISGEWRLIAFEEIYSGEVVAEPDHIPRSIVLNFQDRGKDGDISGQTVTNEVIGEYVLYDELEMAVKDFGGTLKGEPQWGQTFWDNIHNVAKYIRVENSLYLYYRSDSSRMVFTRN